MTSAAAVAMFVVADNAVIVELRYYEVNRYHSMSPIDAKSRLFADPSAVAAVAVSMSKVHLCSYC